MISLLHFYDYFILCYSWFDSLHFDSYISYLYFFKVETPATKSEIIVKYDTKRVGEFTKTITVTTSAGEPIVLTIKGSVLAADAKPVEKKTNL